MKKKYRFVILAFLLILVCGCSNNEDYMPDIDLPLSQMNKEIELIPNPGGGLIAKNDDYYDFQVRNLDEHIIIFPEDYGVKLYLKKENKWQTIENKLAYSEGDKILPLSNEFPPGLILPIIPYIIDMDREETIRIVLIGHFEDSPDQSVGAYYDFTLHP